VTGCVVLQVWIVVNGVNSAVLLHACRELIQVIEISVQIPPLICGNTQFSLIFIEIIP
jgi:hypothetical protein